ncbi:MAG: hypothetical protein U1F68_19265 [Gammaproteobacteria bacterium]
MRTRAGLLTPNSITQPELVKTMAVQPPRGQGRIRLLDIAGVDLQPCGGTHVAMTAEIGRVSVAKIEKKSRLNRRVIVVFDEGDDAVRTG